MSFFDNHNYLKKSGLTILYILFSLVILELTLRLMGFVYKEYMTAQTPKSNPTVCNIIVLGESTPSEYTHEYARQGIDTNHLFPYIVEDKLSEKYNVKVVNLAVPGLTSSTILRNLERQLIEYRPKLVISLIGANDRNKYLNGLNTRLIANSYLVPEFVSELKIYKLGVVTLDVLDGRVKDEYGALVYRVPLEERSFARFSDDKEREIENKQLRANYAAIIDLVRKYNSEVVPITYLHLYDDLKAVFRNIEVEEAVKFVDLSVVDAAKLHPDWFLSSDHWHPSKLGHQLMADGIIKYLEENKTIGQTCAEYER